MPRVKSLKPELEATQIPGPTFPRRWCIQSLRCLLKS